MEDLIDGGGVADTLPGDGMLASASRSQDDGVIGESMNGISTSKSSSQFNSESTIDKGMNGARSSKFSSSSLASFPLSPLILWSSFGEGMYGVLSVALFSGEVGWGVSTTP